MAKKKRQGMTCLPLQYAKGYEDGQLRQVLSVLGGAEADRATPDAFFALSAHPDFFTHKYQGPLAQLNAGLIRKGARMVAKFQETPKESWRDVLTMYAIVQKWSRCKQIYRFDPDFARELAKTKSLRIYPELLRHLPYQTFYLDFQDIPEFQPFDGMFVNVEVSETDDILIHGHRVVADSYYTWYNGWSHDQAKEENGLRSYECLLEDAVNMPDTIPVSPEAKAKYGVSRLDQKSFAETRMFFLQALMYLASEQPEIAESRLTQTTYRPSETIKNKFSEVRQWEVGVRFGAAFRARKNTAAVAAPTEGHREHRSPRPHSRCAHWHLYWTGTGRTEPVLKWIQPTFVGARQDAVATIQKVGR